MRIKIDNGPWKTISVSSNGNFIINWSNYSSGKHVIYAQVYISSADYEPAKIGRTVIYQPRIAKRGTIGDIEMADEELP